MARAVPCAETYLDFCATMLATNAADSYDLCAISPNTLERWGELVTGKRVWTVYWTASDRWFAEAHRVSGEPAHSNWRGSGRP